MARWHLRSHRKPTGAKLGRLRKKRRNERGSLFVETRIGSRKAKFYRGFGANRKTRLVSADTANISDKGKAAKAKIISVKENHSNQQYVRRNIITKGAVIQTDMGLARVTSRPGKDGIVNAVLIEKKAPEKT